ncbi:hypothetical protein HK105_202261 [Polyrhizophydium stewartii]|uniref:Uncharacterized protein n=1 Tax=Polyrhizophydium stewartii TaxID=2732419 RepID=A0ABR4NFV0_9FUNG
MKEKRWVAPTPPPNDIPATLGARPGNTSRPQPNHYRVHKWAKAVGAPAPDLSDPLPPVVIRVADPDADAAPVADSDVVMADAQAPAADTAADASPSKPASPARPASPAKAQE